MLVSTTELAWRARRAGPLGLRNAQRVRLDWRAMIARKNRLVAGWTKGKAAALARQGITVLRGQARFVGPHALRVGERQITAEKIVVATGSAPTRPPIPGVEHALTSAELLDRQVQPRRLVVIGGGFIGLEFAFICARAGARVTVLQAGTAIMPALDEDIRKALLEIGRRAGIDVRTGAEVTQVSRGGVTARIGGKARRFPADTVLVSTGRPPAVAGLGLDAAGVAVERGAIKVNQYRQSPTAPHVYAAGDVNGEHQHTPVAWYEGKLVAENALRDNGRAADFSIFPTAVFTIPAVAQVGLSEAEARRRGQPVAVHRVPFADSSAAAIRDETDGLVKVVYEEPTGRLLGVHILGAGAEDFIHIAAVAMRGGLTRQDLAGMHYVFPTVAGSVFDAMWD